MLQQFRSHLTLTEPDSSQAEAREEAAILIPVVACEKEPAIVLTRRAAHMNSHAGEVAFPGGKRDREDPHLLHTALRETHEEVGVAPDQVEIIGALKPRHSRFGLQVMPYVGFLPQGVDFTPNPAELDAIFQVPLHFFAETPPNPQSTFGGKVYNVPSFQFGEYYIWGLTAVFVVDLLKTIKLR